MRTPRVGHVRSAVWRYGLSLVVLAVLVLLFVELGRAARVDEPTDLDVAVHGWVVRHRERWPAVTRSFRVATRFGDPPGATTATIVVAVGLLALHLRGVRGVGRGEPFLWVAVIVAGRYLGIWLKLVFGRDRPPPLHRLVTEETYSFPSGHSLFAAGFFTMLAALALRVIPPRRRWLRRALVAACAVSAVAIAASRVWLAVHYLTDVVGGLLLGATWVFAVSVVRAGWRHRRLVRAAAAAAGRG